LGDAGDSPRHPEAAPRPRVASPESRVLVDLPEQQERHGAEAEQDHHHGGDQVSSPGAPPYGPRRCRGNRSRLAWDDVDRRRPLTCHDRTRPHIRGYDRGHREAWYRGERGPLRARYLGFGKRGVFGTWHRGHGGCWALGARHRARGDAGARGERGQRRHNGHGAGLQVTAQRVREARRRGTRQALRGRLRTDHRVGINELEFAFEIIVYGIMDQLM